MSRATVRELINQLRDAAIQRRFMEPWDEDRAFVANGGRIIYAVDMDVVLMYASPDHANTRDRGRIPYGRVFSTDSEEVTSVLTQKLADFLFYGLSPDVPLLIIPPIEQELEHVLSALVGRFGRRAPARQLDPSELQAVVAQARDSLGAKSPDLATVERAYLKAQELIYLDSGPEGEFRRLEHLLESGRIVGPDAPHFIKAVGDDMVAATVDHFSRLEDIGRHLNYRDQWIHKLSTEGRKERRVQTERDASALARLQMWNEDLAAHDVKLVYISGSRNLFEAAWRTPMRTGNHRKATFGDYCLRHPRAFVAEPSVLATDRLADVDAIKEVMHREPDFGAQTLLDVMRTFLASFEVRSQLLDERHPFNLKPQSLEVARDVGRRQPQLGETIRERWDHYTRLMRTHYRPPKDVQQVVREALAAIGPTQSSLDLWDRISGHLDERLEGERHKSWEAVFRVATRTGFSLEMFNPTSRSAARTVPPLSFDSWRLTHRFIETVSRWHSGRDFQTDAYLAGLDDVQREDPSGYAYYLAHAAIFGSRGLWDTAALLAERALTHATSRVGREDNANGREAAYLLSVCRRHAATGPEALEGLPALVELARRLHQQEKATRSALDAVPERFEGELYAIRTSQLLFARFPQGRVEADTRDGWGTSRAALLDDLDNLAVRLSDRLREARERQAEAHDAEREERIAQTLSRLEVRVATNLASLMMIDATPSSLRMDQRFRQATGKLLAYERRAATNSPEIGSFVRTIIDSAASILEERGADRRARLQRLQEALDEQAIGELAVFPYDIERLRQLRVLVGV